MEQLRGVAEQFHHDLAPTRPIDDIEHPGDDGILLVARHHEGAGSDDVGMGGLVEEGPEVAISVTTLHVTRDVQLDRHVLTSSTCTGCAPPSLPEARQDAPPRGYPPPGTRRRHAEWRRSPAVRTRPR